jgi:O-antigen/teichoic acid export membrane protein
VAKGDEVGAGDQLARAVTRAALWVAVEKWAERLLSLGVFALLTRLVDVSAFGLMSIATVVTSLITVFVDSGFSKSLVQSKEITERSINTAFWASVAISVVLGGGVALAAPALAGFFGEPLLSPILRVLAICLLLAALSGVPAALLERRLKFKQLSIRQFVGAVVGALVAIPIALGGGGVWALVVQTVATLVASVITLWGSTSWRPKFEFSFSDLRTMVRFSVSFLGVDLLNAVQMNVDKLIIGLFLTPTTLGYYTTGQRAVNMLAELMASILSRISLSTFSRIQTDRARVARTLKKFVFISGVTSVPVFGAAAVVAPQLIPFLFGANWLPAVPIFQILCVSAAVNSMTSVDKSVLLASGANRSALGIGIAQVLVGTALVRLAVPFGGVAVAVSRSALALGMIPLRGWLLSRAIGLSVGGYAGRLGICVVAFLPSLVLGALLQQTDWAAAGSGFFGFAIPVALLLILLYVGSVWVVCGKDYRSMLRSVATALLSRARPARGEPKEEAGEE